MKKRVLSLLLSALMILSLLPAAALAADGDVLRMHIMEERDGGWTERFISGGGEWSIDDSWVVEFYLHHADGSTTRVAPEDLSLPRFMRMNILEPGIRCELGMRGLGSGFITYEEDDVEYRMDMAAVLPHLGVYSAMPFTLDTLMDEVTIDEACQSFYIALCPDYAARGSKIDSVVLRDDGRNLSEVSAIKISADGSYAEVTITDLSARDGYFFGVQVVNDGDGPSGEWGRGVHILNDLPGLYYSHLNHENDSWTVDLNDLDNGQLWCCPGSSNVVNFYFGKREQIEAGEVNPIPLDELSFPAYLEAAELSEREPTAPEGAIDIRATRFERRGEATDIVYERNGEMYTLSAAPALPNIGFYTEPVAKKSTYIYDGHPFTVTEDARTVYLCSEDTEWFRLDGIDRWYTDGWADVVEVEDMNGEYFAFTIKDGKTIPNEELGVRVNFRSWEHDRWRDRTTSAWAYLKNGQPSLMFRYLEWDEQQQCWYEAEDRRLESVLNLEAGNDHPVQFYYGTSDDYEKLELSDLNIPSSIMSTYMRENVAWVMTTQFEGSGVITYAAEGVQMKVRVVQPDFGFYSAPTAIASTYLGEEVEISQAGDTFYVIAGPNRTIDGIDSIRYQSTNGDMTNHFDVQVAQDGSYAAITVKEDEEGRLPMGGEYRVDVEQDWGIRYLHVDLVRMDLPQLAVPTDLNWHRDYEWNSTRFVERMGSMSFYGEKPTQNRYDLEVYSAADGYTNPVVIGDWHFGDMELDRYYSAQDFIYDEPGSGTYKFRVKARGDGVHYRDSDWSGLSDAWTYTAPAQRLPQVDENSMMWTRWDGRYAASWEPVEHDGVGWYEVYWYYEDAESGNIQRIGGTFDIPAHGGWNVQNGAYMEPIHDEIIEECGNVPYYFKVRAIPADMTKYSMSPFTAFSFPLDTEKVTDMVNNKLDSLVPDSPADPKPTVAQVQQALAQDTADLRTAMAADQSVSGGPSSGTIDRIRELEQSVADNVEQKVEAKNSAPQQIKEIAADIEMVGATLNWADEHPETGTDPDVTLVIEQPKKGIVIPEQWNNAVQFSMKLHGAIDKDDRQPGQQLIVPIVIDMPVPSIINPEFLVVLHQLDSGEIEQLKPYVYWDETKGQHRATFVIDSFSDFALAEYEFRFPVAQVDKTMGDAPFVVAAAGNADGSEVTYSSSNPAVAEVDPVTGRVSIKGVGAAVITATASATEFYPEVQAEYTLRVSSQSAGEPDEDYDDEYEDDDYVPPVSKEEPAKMTFVDVSAEDWFYEAVQYVYEHDIMAGVGDNSFAPESELTRAMVAQVLFNMDENGYTGAASLFDDVKAGEWYEDAVNWAAAEGVMSGYGGRQFGAMDSVTREQLAMILYNYEASKGCPIEGKIILGMYTDAGDVSFWAVNAVEWALANGILRSDNGVLNPGVCAERAQVALALMSFCENVIK